jgi:hypothetical protein
MATIDTLQDAVNTLTSSTTELLNEVNVEKSTLETSATNAAGSASDAATYASNASSSASSASTSATQAGNSATQAAASAASANQIVTGVASGRPSIRPTLNLDFANSKTLDPRITFSRSSAGTYYDGKTTVKAEENLLTNSESLQDWSIGLACSKAANTTTAPDGTTTADSLIGDGTSTWHGIYRGFTPKSFPFQYSVYAKAGTESYLQMRTNSSPSGYANFDLTNGTVTQSDVMTGTITSVGNGWYRCSVNVTTGTISTIGLDISDSGTIGRAGGNTASGNIYLWGAQVEERDSLTAYTPTTSQPITNYIPVLQTAASGEARFDHDPVTGESKGLLIEEQRTNLKVNSNLAIDTIGGEPSKSRISVIAGNGIVAPNGELADTGVGITSNTNGYIYKYSWSATSGQKGLISVFAKKGQSNDLSASSIRMLFSTGGSGSVQFNLNDGTVYAVGGDCEAFMEDVGNGWYRCSAIITATSTATILMGAYLNVITTRTGVPAIPDMHLWGWDIQTNVSFPTSYIPTSGSQVTRNSDTASMTGTNFSDWYRQDEGTLFSDAIMGNAKANYIFYMSNGTSGNRIGTYMSGAGRVRFLISSGTNQADTLGDTVYASGDEIKTAAAYAVNDIVAVDNASSPETDTNALIPTPINRLFIGGYYDGSVYGKFHIKKLAYYPARLSNSELQALTED